MNTNDTQPDQVESGIARSLVQASRDRKHIPPTQKLGRSWRRWRHLLLLIVIGLLLVPFAARGDSLRSARKALARGHYNEALNASEAQLSSSDPATADEAHLITAEALLGLRRYSETINLLVPHMRGGAPQAADAPWIRLLALSLQGQGLLLEAADWWLTYAGFGKEQERESKDNLRNLEQVPLPQRAIAYLLWKYPGHELLCTFLPSYISIEQKRGHTQEAYRAWLIDQKVCHGRSHLSDQLPDAFIPIAEPPVASDFFSIGLLAPLNGPFAKYGIALANGADVARRIYNANSRQPVKLSIADTGDTPASCLSAVARLYGQGVRVFIGEIFSLQTLVCAAYLKDRDGILISPTATDSLVARQGSGVYICNMGVHEKLTAMADYMADSLGVNRLAMFWPNHSTGRSLARTYGDLAIERGISITFDEPYRPGTTDFKRLLGGPHGGVIGSIDAVFCPGDMRELVAMISQLTQQGFLGPFIGMEMMGDEIVSSMVDEFGLVTLYPGVSYVATQEQTEAASFE